MNPILFQHYPSCCASAGRFPYVGKIAVDKENVKFVCQFVKKNVTKYKYEKPLSENQYITGTPIKFPIYENFSQAFSMRTHGSDISTSPWQDEIDSLYLLLVHEERIIDNYIDILFHEAVYPIRVSVYEIYNPGNIIRIWAQDFEKQWFLLWNGSPQIVPPASRLFSPPLESCNFKTNRLRIEFKSNSWDYYSKLDAVMLIGTSELILPRNPEESITNLLKRISCIYPHNESEDVHNLTIDYKNAHMDIVHLQQNFHEHCIVHHKRKVPWKIFSCVHSYRQRHYRHLSLKNSLNSAKRIKLSSDEHKELPPHYSLSMFCDEILLKILENLDLMTLCRLNQVNKHFYYLTQDSEFYKRLNVRNVYKDINDTYIYDIFSYFTPRCKNLQQLDLTANDFSVSDFVKFLDNCGNRLTHLRLSICKSVNDFALHKISEICKNLKQLELEDCELITNKGFSYLEKLQNLEHLNVNFTRINTVILCKILQKNQQMRRLYLDATNISQDAVAIQLKNSCKNLEVIYLSFFMSCYLTLKGINALADCKNLRKLAVPDDECYLDEHILNKLLSSCQRLEEIILSYVSNETVESLTQCQHLKRLHLQYITSDKFSVIFEKCPKLQELHLLYCNTIPRLIKQWRKKYPHVTTFVYVDSDKQSHHHVLLHNRRM